MDDHDPQRAATKVVWGQPVYSRGVIRPDPYQAEVVFEVARQFYLCVVLKWPFNVTREDFQLCNEVTAWVADLLLHGLDMPTIYSIASPAARRIWPRDTEWYALTRAYPDAGYRITAQAAFDKLFFQHTPVDE